MGFRFRRILPLVTGVRLNLSKSGVSATLGKRGAAINLGKKGARATVGLPGSGLSYSTYLPHEQGKHEKRSRLWLFLLLAGVVLLVLYFTGA